MFTLSWVVNKPATSTVDIITACWPHKRRGFKRVAAGVVHPGGHKPAKLPVTNMRLLESKELQTAACQYKTIVWETTLKEINLFSPFLFLSCSVCVRGMRTCVCVREFVHVYAYLSTSVRLCDCIQLSVYINDDVLGFIYQHYKL